MKLWDWGKACVAAVLMLALVGCVSSGTSKDGVATRERSDYTEELRLWRLPAEQGDVEAQTYLGVMYYKGRGVSQDYAEAMRWFRKAADQGDVEAQAMLGVMYYKGQGVSQDYAEAARWVRKAAEQG